MLQLVETLRKTTDLSDDEIYNIELRTIQYSKRLQIEEGLLAVDAAKLAALKIAGVRL